MTHPRMPMYPTLQRATRKRTELEIIAGWIRGEFAARRWKPRQFREMLDLTPYSAQHLWLARRPFNTAQLGKLATAFGTTPWQLLQDAIEDRQ